MTWQPIETAPKGTPILVTDGTHIVTAEIDHSLLAGGLWLRSYGFSGYEWDWDINDKALTHWMPLPDPPKEDV